MGDICNCPSWMGWVVLIVGILYLLADLNVFNWGISWYTALFVLMGLSFVMKK